MHVPHYASQGLDVDLRGGLGIGIQSGGLLARVALPIRMVLKRNRHIVTVLDLGGQARG